MNNPYQQQNINLQSINNSPQLNNYIQSQDDQQMPIIQQQNNDQNFVNQTNLIYIPSNDQRMYLDQQSKKQALFESEKAKFERDLKDIKAFGINTYEEAKNKTKEGYEELKKNNPIIQKAEDQGKQIMGKVNVIAGQLKQEYDKLEEKYQQFMKEQKEKLNIWARTKLQIIIMDLIIKSKEDIKDAIKDPYMYEWIQNIIDNLIDENWPQIEKEILYRLRINNNDLKFFQYQILQLNRMIIDDPVVHQEVDPKRCCLIACLCYFPNKYLYERIPYNQNKIYQDNRSTWYQFRRFWFWFFMLFEIFPFYGIQSFFYFLVFLMIDKKDEWQLVRYLIVYKQLQFMFCGVIGGSVGYIQYFVCQSLGRKDYLSEYKKCTQEGPGVNVNIYADIIGIILQIILTWFAYFLIPFSKSKGKDLEFKYNKEQLYEQKNKEENEIKFCCCTIDTSKGGRLRRFMIYDMIIFVILVGAFFGFIYGLDKKSEWQIRQILFMTKTLYCLLNFPFLIFTIPILPQIITEARKTGYDQYGVCVPRIINYTDKEWDEIEKQYDQTRSRIVAQNDIDEEKQILQEIDVGDLYK